MRSDRAAFLLLLVASLAACGTVQSRTDEPQSASASVPLPPPPPQPGQLAPMSDAVKELYGEWRQISGPRNANSGRLTIWSPMFSWGSGCDLTQGQLRDLGDGRYAVEDYTRPSSDCRSRQRLAPFDAVEVSITMPDSTSLRIARGDEIWQFSKVDVIGTYPSEDFVRGEWLLADTRGRPFRGGELTRVTFGSEYQVEAANCSFATNGWLPDRDRQVRVGGSYSRENANCRARTLGDRLAKLGMGAEFVAEPVETRMTVRIGGTRATLVPAARYPELARDAETVAPYPWAQELAAASAKLDLNRRFELALRAVALGGEGFPGVETPADPRTLAFAGLNAWQYEQAAKAGLLPAADQRYENLEQHLAGAPIVALAVLEGIRPVDRGDGLSLDYLYRVRESWRGRRETGDLLIVRMPALVDLNRSPAITPETGAEVLLLASRTGYIAGRLSEGMASSSDPRVVQMTLPLMRIVGGKLVEAIEGANVLGSAGFAGTGVDEARELARSADRRMRQIAPPRPADAFGNWTVRRYFITRIGDRALPDPTRLWIEYDGSTNMGNRNGYGGVTGYFDGCTPVSIQFTEGRRTASANAVACPGDQPNGDPVTEVAVQKAAQWIDQNYFPDIICVSTCPTDPEYTVPLPDGDVVMRAMLR
ncbi:hypothetical protein [Altererythrobacter aquiaggeris]|uniref:hypothetical protein n=1 Tax=Aestuarierythrobacter aquiaggeris TaxID=1898396 RepID=UPI00301AB40A